MFCRDRDNDSGEVRVYPGKLQVSQAFCIVPVDSNTTVGDLIRESLHYFSLEDANCEEFRCSEVLLDRGGEYTHKFAYLNFVFEATSERTKKLKFSHFLQLLKGFYRGTNGHGR